MVTRKNLGKLETYRAKRQAERTPEPFSSSLPPSQRFVVQLHDARRRHYDFRLELDGVLKSWAVPKGPSPNPADKRLAVEVEDHPLEYVNFEGNIPEGNYGAGAVIVWDRGRWVPLNDPHDGLRAGKLLFELRGYKLRGRWTLVRTRRAERDWLLIKEKDDLATTEGTEAYPPDSIRSGRTVEQLAAGTDAATTVRAELASFDLPALPPPARLRPMLAMRGEPFSDPGWVFELKYDGYRLLGIKQGAKVTLYSRAGNELTATFPEVADVLAALPYEALVVDGEVIVHDDRGLPSFARLQTRGRLTNRLDVARAAVELPATYYLFDLLGFDGFDLRALPLLARKAMLQAILPSAGPLHFSEHIPAEGEAMFEQVERMGLEGIVGKRADSRYVSGRSRDWVKINAHKSDDFVIIGHARSETGQAFAGLLLGQFGEGGELVYAGRVGTGFSARQRREIARRLDEAAPLDPPANAPEEKGLVWLASGLVAQVRFKTRTGQGVLRQPAFERLRPDKPPAECRLPAADPVPEMPAPAAATVERVRFTNLDKLFWPAEGYTKGDMIRYYEAVGPWLLPYLRDRPAVLTRYPDGIGGKSFYQKDAPVYAPDWIRLETIWSEQAAREIRYFVLDDLESLLYVANMGSIPLHVWSSRVTALERPDWCILDLDPKGAPFANVVRIARYLLDLCKKIGLPTHVKTSGSTGLHILVPLGARYTYAHSRTLAEVLARMAVRKLGDIATVTRAVGERAGKVYVDYLQNGHGRLLVAPFSLRALPGAPVSMPVRPRQVTSRLRFDRFTIRTVPSLLEKEGDAMTDVLSEAADLLGALEALERHLED